MKEKYEFTKVSIGDLNLDFDNPRFAELYSGSPKEEDLINYLLYNEAGDEVAKAIVQSGEFYLDRPLWVIKDKAKYLVKDGNRRAAALKALHNPTKYGLSLAKLELDTVPVLIYKDQKDLEIRILQEHTSNLFREWDRIAKALEVYRLFSSGSSIESMKEIDSDPSALVKLASFYYEAVGIGGDDLKKLLRSGRGATGGKTIIFERLFRYRDSCGYDFQGKPIYKVRIKDKSTFSSYISALIGYLKDHPKTTHTSIDEEGENFLNYLEEYGFKVKEAKKHTLKGNKIEESKVEATQKASKKKTIKERPTYARKKIPAALEKLIKECYDLDEERFTNAKIALTRIVLECSLKYIVENTEYKIGKTLAQSNHFREAFFTLKGVKRTYTDFEKLKEKFTKIILDIGIKKAFEDFDLDRSHQIIHNYRVGGIPADAKALCNNLIDLLEFILKEDQDLINSLEIKSL